VWLVNARGNRFALPGPIVAGSYEIQASFDDEALANVGTLLVPKQGSVVLTCSALFGRCSADD